MKQYFQKLQQFWTCVGDYLSIKTLVMEDCQNIWSHTVILFNRNNQTLQCEKCGEKKGKYWKKIHARLLEFQVSKLGQNQDGQGHNRDKTGSNREKKGNSRTNRNLTRQSTFSCFVPACLSFVLLVPVLSLHVPVLSLVSIGIISLLPLEQSLIFTFLTNHIITVKKKKNN